MVTLGVVHLTGGVAGLAGTIILGPRKGRFTNPAEFETHNLPLVVQLGGHGDPQIPESDGRTRYNG